MFDSVRPSPAPRRPAAFRLLGCSLVAAGLLVAFPILPPAGAQELEPGTNAAGVIDYPTALDQPTRNLVRGSLALVNVATPDLRPASAGLSHQFGSLQVLADLYWAAEPVRQFNYAEGKAKLRILNLDAQRTYLALGVVSRWTDQQSKDAAQIDNKPWSLLGVMTTELFPFEEWGAFLVNLYLDNRFFDAGLKVQLYQGIKFVSEVDYHHGDVNDQSQKWRTKAGFEFEAEQNVFFQILYDDGGNHARAQLGWGF